MLHSLAILRGLGGSIIKHVEDEILGEDNWAPDVIVEEAIISGEFKRDEVICAKTIYNYIDAGLLKVKNIDLAEKVSRKLTRPKHCRINKTYLGKSIEERPESVENREEFGHFEIDSVVGRQDKEDDVLLTLIERKTRREFIFKMDGKDAESANYAVFKILNRYGALAPKIFKSITSDNGSEFAELVGEAQ